MEKEHLEIILEDINSKFDLVIEGYAVLDRKLDTKFEVLSEKIDLNSFKIDLLNKKIDHVDERLGKKIDNVEKSLGEKIDDVAADLKAHRTDTEIHHGVYRVKER